MSLSRWVVLLAVVSLIGCSPSREAEAPPANDPPVESPAVEVDVSISDWASVDSAIAAHNGQVVVVDLWSTTCAPCRREFPGLVKLHQQHGAEVACISVSLDYYGAKTEPPESFQPAVTKFLTDQQATFENFICSDASDEVLAKIDASGVPVVLVYGADGQLAKLFEDDGSYGEEGFTYEQHIAPLVNDMVTVK